MADQFAGAPAGRTAPGQGFIDVSAAKSDTVDLAFRIRQIYATGAGNVKVQAADGSVYTFPIDADGVLPVDIEIVRVWSTGTTATGLLGIK